MLSRFGCSAIAAHLLFRVPKSVSPLKPMPPPRPVQVWIAAVDRAALSTRRPHHQVAGRDHLLDDPEFIDDVVVRFALGCR